jgi:hypothetical protein
VDEFTYIEVAHRDEATYQQIRWDDGERPDWWRERFERGIESSNVWVFRRKGQWFAAQDLEAVCERFPRLRQSLFLNVPLFIGLELSVDDFEVQLYSMVQFMDQQWRRLRWLRAEVEHTAGMLDKCLLRFGEELAERGALELLFMGPPSEYSFGVTPAYMRQISSGTSFYELRNALAAYEDEINAARAKERAAEADKKEERRKERERKQQVKRREQARDRLIGYLAQPDFDPLNKGEAEAHALYMKYAAASTSSEQYALMNELKAFITEKGIA